MNDREEQLEILERMNSLTPNLEGLDPFSRTQPGLHISNLFPTPDDGTCSCGCGKKLEGRRTRWATDVCSTAAVDLYFIRCGSSNTVRYWVAVRDRRVCVGCGEEKPWDADHILPVVQGGGGCGLDGFQTMCQDCHKAKTAGMRKAIATVRRHERQKDQGALAL